jgi:hypothetical protein
MKTKITDQILREQQVFLPKRSVNNIASVIASFFAAVFSMSILKETKNQIDEPFVFVLLLVFTILFLAYNEYIKVSELRKKFAHKGGSFILIIVTFLISISLSGIGIYLWTNKTLQSETVNDKKLSQTSLLIESKYNHLIDSVQSLSILNEPEYQRLKSDAKYWKYRTAADLDERTQIRERIKNIESDIKAFSTSFEQKKENSISRFANQKLVETKDISTAFNNETKFISRNNSLSLIFFFVVLVTKFIIILLAKEHVTIEKTKLSILESETAKRFVSQYKFITDVLSRKDKIEFDDVVFSPYFKFSKDATKRNKEVKNIYYLLGDLKINNAPVREAQEKLKNYYESIINL